MPRPLLISTIVTAMAMCALTSLGWAQSPGASMRELARQVALDYMHRGQVAEQEHQLPAAEDYFHRAIQADAGYLPPYLSYARLLSARSHTDEALLVLEHIPPRAMEQVHDLIEIARVRSQVGDLEGALEMLRGRTESIDAARARVEISVGAGRFPEALSAGRLFADLAQGTESARQADLMVRALVILVGDADAVTSTRRDSSIFRRILAE